MVVLNVVKDTGLRLPRALPMNIFRAAAMQRPAQGSA